MENLKQKPSDVIETKQENNPEKTVDNEEDLQVKSKDVPREPEVEDKSEARKANDESKPKDEFNNYPGDKIERKVNENDQDEKLKIESPINRGENPDDDVKDEPKKDLESENIRVEKANDEEKPESKSRFILAENPVEIPFEKIDEELLDQAQA